MNRTAILIGAGVILAGSALAALIANVEETTGTGTEATETSSAGDNGPDATLMPDAQFGERVRAYLLANPEVIFEAVAVMEERQQDMQSANDAGLIAEHASALFDDDSAWSGGNPEGDVTIVEFMDYRCGYCRRAFPEVEELIALDGDIRLIIKEFPILGEQSEVAARFAIATKQQLGDDAYKAVHDALMSFQGDMAVPALEELATDLGLDAGAIVSHMTSDDVTDVIDSNRALGQALQISGTPSFVMEDQILRGYVPLEGMQEIVSDLRG